MRRVLVALAALAVILAGLIGLRLWTQARALAAPSGGSGEIEGIVVDLSSRVGARIVEQPVQEGDAVKAGQLLVRLDCADPAAALAEAEARLASAGAQAAAADAAREGARRTRAAAVAGREAAAAQADAVAAQRDAAERQARRLEALPADVAAASVDQTRAGATGLARQVDAARAQVAASEAQARAADQAIRASGAQADAARAGVRAGEAAVRRAQILVDECVVRAPRDAEVSKLPHEVGELVPAGSVLARLVDVTAPKAIFYLPNAEVGAVRPGARALVVADAWPGQVFEGTVRTVSIEAEFTPRNIQTRTDRDRLVYPVEVRVVNRDGRLRDGMPVQVTIPGAVPTP